MPPTLTFRMEVCVQVSRQAVAGNLLRNADDGLRSAAADASLVERRHAGVAGNRRLEKVHRQRRA
jgi:hypothetical protein